MRKKKKTKVVSLDRYWKPEGSFKPGWTTELLRRMKEAWKDCCIEVKHIENRHNYLKEKYYAILEMLKQTGVGGSVCSWNSESCLIECDREWYSEWVKKHKKDTGLFGTPFPYYEVLDKIYARDRAMGNVVETIGDTTSDFIPTVEITYSDSEPPRRPKRKSETDIDTPPVKRKKKQEDPMVKMYDKFSNSFETAMGGLNSHVSTIACALDREQLRVDADHARELEREDQIMEDLRKISELTFRQVQTAGRILIDNRGRYAQFLKVGTEEKYEFVKWLLDDSAGSSTN